MSGLAVASVAGTLMLAPATGFAQGQGPQPATPQDQTEMQAFVTAFETIQTIQTEAQAEINAAESEQAAQQVQMSATEDMVAAVEAQGLTVDRFNALVAGLQADADFRQEFSAEMQQ
ncbi:MAG: DUF4168 domain-containing protein [Azospirillaceae bacterium]